MSYARFPFLASYPVLCSFEGFTGVIYQYEGDYSESRSSHSCKQSDCLEMGPRLCSIQLRTPVPEAPILSDSLITEFLPFPSM